MFDKWNKILRPVTYVISFSIAVIWAIFIHFEQYGSINLLKDVNTKIIYNIPITSNLSNNKYAISQIPTAADVELSGTKYELDKIDNQGSNFQLYIPNQKLVLGKNTVEIKVKNFSNTIQVSVLNKFVSVHVSEVISRSINAYTHLYNQQKLGNYKVKDIENSHKSIKFTGPNNIIDAISSAELWIDCSKLTVGKNIVNPMIIPIDSNGNKVIGVDTLDKITTTIFVVK